MAKNQRQRRPLQDDTRTAKQTVRERAQASKRQRDRIEENRDRRERRRERQRSRRQQVDSIRSPKEDLRADRLDSRLVPVEDTFLGQPVGAPTELPVLIGERWTITSNQTIGTGSESTVSTWDRGVYTTERNGYPRLFQEGGVGVWRIPAGLAGIWEICFAVTWAATSTAGVRTLKVEYLDDTIIAYSTFDGETTSGVLITTAPFQEGDEMRFTVQQDSGGDLDLVGSSTGDFTYASLIFLGK